MGATRQMIARGQFIQYWLHIDAEVAERELAAFGRASGAQLILVFLLAILVVDHGPHEQQETPGEVPYGSIAPPDPVRSAAVTPTPPLPRWRGTAAKQLTSSQVAAVGQ